MNTNVTKVSIYYSCCKLLAHITACNLCKKIGKCVSCKACTAQENNFELILMVKMETRHPVEGSFGSEFPVICNHCVVMAV